MKDELLKELKESMQNKDELRKNTITMLRAAILQIEKDEQKVLTEDEMVAVVAKEVKKRRESIPEYEKGNRPDIIEQLKKEIDILSKYLPEQLSEDEIVKIVKEAMETTQASGMKDMGKVMQEAKKKTESKADGKVVSDIVKEMLSKM
jgi:uncharacterized protein YqeY